MLQNYVFTVVKNVNWRLLYIAPGRVRSRDNISQIQDARKSGANLGVESWRKAN